MPRMGELQAGVCSATGAQKWTRRSSPRDAQIADSPNAAASRRDDRRAERSSLSLGDGDRARARDPRPERAPARGQRRHDRSIASLEAVARRLEEMQAQARGQATRIRMKALREAVEVSRRVQEIDRRRGRRRRRTAAGAGFRATASRRATPLRGQGQARHRPARRLLAAGRLRGRGRPLGASGDLGRALLRGPGDPLDAARRAGRAAARARGALAARLQGPPHGPGQPDPRRRRGQGPEQRAA